MSMQAFKYVCQYNTDYSIFQRLYHDLAYEHFRLALSRTFVIDLCCCSGSFEIVSYLLDTKMYQVTPLALDNAASFGHLEIVKLLLPLVDCTNKAIDTASLNGYCQVVKILLEAGKPYTYRAIEYASTNGHLEVVKLLHTWDGQPNRIDKHATMTTDIAYESNHSNTYPESYSNNPLDLAASNGHLQVVEYLHNEKYGCSVVALDFAAKRGYHHVVDYLLDNRTEGCSSEAIDQVACTGDLEMIQKLHFRAKAPCSYRAMNNAAKYLNVVEWLSNNRQEGCNKMAMDNASALGALDVLQYLHINRTEGCSTAAMDMAAKYGQLETLIFLRTHRTEGCTAEAINGAALYNHLKIIKYLKEYCNATCTTTALNYAVTNNSIELIQYLLNNFKVNWDFHTALDFARSNNCSDEVFNLLDPTVNNK
ncbi:hypothetical protein DFA_04554 [Cavenderia fasciculata]|uniref:Ankyrin repeat-containing protein n=1 Tax=Cavenderia fasciculata TaxID=261658 RepID=F4PPW9_CACFS|nr:uncharacterized protein DFA_04554 [Cavenderia fasciculata]EGG22432.1 hypothetical protein DFA_04554 [Cavenderia fasciculata]|eukprot:XP_004360283.1 hypothetical protein DFA_04554 [Cavenderia fasciculata]